MTPLRIALAMGPGDSSNAVFHAVDTALGLVGVVEEAPVGRLVLTRRRVGRFGVRHVTGQLAFQLGMAPVLRAQARERIADIVREHAIDLSPVPEARKTRVASINGADGVAALRALRPDVVLVNGTRIIRREYLEAVGCPFVNTHAGITPAFRGVHGGYWALVEQEPELCGVTVHLVDPGIDTGAVLAQARVYPTDADNFASYRFLQLAAAIPCLLRVLPEVARGRATPIPALSPRSRFWSHPTLRQYLGHRWLLGVR